MTDEIKKDTVDYRDPTPFDGSKLNSVSEITQAIRHKLYGKDTREAMAQSLEALVKVIQDTGGNQSAEVIAARGGHEILSMREDAQDNAISQNNALLANKANINYIDNYLSSVTAVPETFASLTAIKDKYPSGKNGLMVAADNGHKYIWTNNTWTDAGVYQSTGLADGSVTPNKLALCATTPILSFIGLVNVNTVTKMIEFPAGAIMLPYGNRMGGKSFDAQSVSYSGSAWIVYDLTAETIRLENNPSGNVAVIGWINGSGWLYITGVETSRDGQLSTTAGNISAYSMPIIYSSPNSGGNIIYDAKERTLKFPKNFVLTYGGKSIELATKSNSGTIADIISIASTGYLIYYPTTKTIDIGSPGVSNVVLGYVDTGRKQVNLNTQIVEVINDKDPVPKTPIKITYLGDSITEGVKTNKRYLEYIEDKLTANNYDVTTVNLGIGGTRITSTTDRPDGFVNRWQDIPSDSDIIVVFGGTNDYGGSSPMGEMTDDKTTFKGALNELITSIQNTYPNADLLVLTPIKRYYRSSTEPWSDEDTWKDGDKFANDQNLLLSDYVEAVKEVAGYNGAKVIDLYHNSGFNPRVESNYNRNTTDGLHPNAVGHYLLYKQIYPEVLNCAQNREEVTDPKWHN